MLPEIKSPTKTEFQSIYTALLPIRPIGNYKGFRLLVSAIEQILKQNTPTYNLSCDIYPPVAQIYNCNSSSIERNLRTLLLNMNMCTLQQLTGQNIPGKITVSQLIDILVVYFSFS
ncbi:MAG: hypothetical protein IJ410_01795 [Oscillospiraceae bacterium]|nr:hypothetical protein [Oscillospiraceae bacterium]